MNNQNFSLVFLISMSLLSFKCKAQVWSPDGKKIAFFYIHSIEDIYTVRPDGSNFEVLDSHPERDFAPQWSPNGKNLIFTSIRDGHHEIYRYSFKKMKMTKLTNTEFNSEGGHYSPNGKHIVFISDRKGNKDIFIMKKNGRKIRQLTFTSEIETTPRFSPDGKRILFRRAKSKNEKSNLFVMNIDGSCIKQITMNSTGAFHQSWSPDGEKICYITLRNDAFEIHTIFSDGSNDKTIVSKSGYQSFYPHWSPDGKSITFTRDVMEGTKVGLPALIKVDMLGNEIVITNKNSFKQ